VSRLAKVLAAVMRDQDCKVIIFAQTKKRVDDFFFTIKRLGYPVFPIHGDKRQQERDRVLEGTFISLSYLRIVTNHFPSLNKTFDIRCRFPRIS
jgi:hypothetical protein